MKKNNVHIKPTEKISHLFMYVMMGIIAFVFLLYYLVGYNAPATWDEKYNSPLLTDLVIFLMMILLVGALIAVSCSKLLSLRKNQTPAVVNGIHGKRVTWCVTGGVIAVLAATCLALPTDRLFVNGEAYDDAFWLHVTNMFAASSLVLIVVGLCAIVFGMFQNKRKK